MTSSVALTSDKHANENEGQSTRREHQTLENKTVHSHKRSYLVERSHDKLSGFLRTPHL